MNKVSSIFAHHRNILNVYITAGYPALESTVALITALDKAGADIIEVGMPYSDPLADGATIQQSSEVALKNGMTLPILFGQLKTLKGTIDCPLMLMGYYNQLLQYGVDSFLLSCVDAGIGALIIPDLPMDIYESDYKEMFERHGIEISFLITPFTSEERIKKANDLSSAFIYMVSQTSITGNASVINDQQIKYFERINLMDLSTPRLIGFGIHDKASYDTACLYSNGAIIGSAFIRALGTMSAEHAIQKIVGLKT
jgi:tryptophan synthase alpha chain